MSINLSLHTKTYHQINAARFIYFKHCDSTRLIIKHDIKIKESIGYITYPL